MAPTKEDESGICCFCAGKLTKREAAMIAIEPPDARDEVQRLWAHSACLMKRIHPSIPMHPNLWGDD
jgi:hypothetical protein